MITEINYTIDEIFDSIKGEWLQHYANTSLEYLSLDSRKTSNPSKTIFWAITSESGDGSDYIAPLYKAGVRNFVTQKKQNVSKFKEANFILVNNSVDALQDLAASHRKKFKKIHIIGITGSNGKTIVKEWLSSILSPHYSVVKNPRSYNSQIGVPLSILQIRPEHQIGIFEAGISKPGEMQRLEKLIRPDTGILTNIGSAHDEGFKDRREKAFEKMQLFRHAKRLVLPGRIKEIEDQSKVTSLLKSTSILTWGKKGCNFEIEAVRKSESNSSIQISYGRKKFLFSIPFTDEASIENSISCFCTLTASGYFKSEMVPAFQNLHAVSMRLEMKPGIHNSIIVNDSYSNDLQSLAIAVDFLKQQHFKQNTVIISDLLQSGLTKNELYRKVATILEKKKINRIIGIGNDISKARNLLGNIPQQSFYRTTGDFIAELSKYTFHDEAILIKGARAFSFEKITRLLEAQLHETILSVNLSNLAHNIRIYRSLLKPGTKLMAMVKAFAYGAGSDQIASLLQYIQADYLTVAYVDEGVKLRDAGITLPIMVLNVEQSNFENLVRYRLEPEIFSFRLLNNFRDFLYQKNISEFPVHIKIDTGMHRLGFELADIRKLSLEIISNNRIKIKSIFTHLSSSDNPEHDSFTIKQFDLFKKVIAQLKKVITYPFYCHLSNTAAISRFPEMQLDMVRLGIGMYGIDENPAIKFKLKAVSKLSTTISQIKNINPGEVVGYGMNIIKEHKTIATVGIGYADGYHRILGNGRGKMLVNGILAPTIGNICMDMTMLDITGIRDVNEGDEVIVFNESLPIQDVARWAQTIPYEILTGISPRVKRIYFEES